MPRGGWMLSLLYIFTVCLTTNTYANCELFRSDYHTEATYVFPQDVNPIYEMRTWDSGILFNQDNKDVFLKNGFFEKKDDSYGAYDEYSLKDAEIKQYSSFLKRKFTFIRLKENVLGIPSEKLVYIDLKNRKLESISAVRLNPVKEVYEESSKGLPKDVLKELKRVVELKKIKYINNQVIKNKGVPVEWIQQLLGFKKWKLIQVKMRFPIKEMKALKNDEVAKQIHFWFSFLTMDDKDFWYIANSTNDPCAGLPSESESGWQYHPSTLKTFYGIDLKKADDELIYSFGEEDKLYYLKFKKHMIVIPN